MRLALWGVFTYYFGLAVGYWLRSTRPPYEKKRKLSK